MRYLGLGAAVAAVMASVSVVAPAATTTINFNPGTLLLFLQSPQYDFYRYPPNYDVAVHGTIANGYFTGDFIQVGAGVNLGTGAMLKLNSFDVRGTGTLQFTNFDQSGVPASSFPVTNYQLTGDWQTINFTPQSTGFFFQVKAGSNFDLDNIVLGDPTAGVGGGNGVPEPASWALLIGGFGLVGGAARRRVKLVSPAT